MRKKHGIIMALLCMLMFVLTACGGGDKAATAPAEKDTLIVADGASPKTLGIQEQQMITYLQELWYKFTIH